jgi:hypothetical protein
MKIQYHLAVASTGPSTSGNEELYTTTSPCQHINTNLQLHQNCFSPIDLPSCHTYNFSIYSQLGLLIHYYLLTSYLVNKSYE